MYILLYYINKLLSPLWHYYRATAKKHSHRISIFIPRTQRVRINCVYRYPQKTGSSGSIGSNRCNSLDSQLNRNAPLATFLLPQGSSARG